MRQKTAQHLTNLNQVFYQENAHSFSQTRQSPWSGWEKTLEFIQQFRDPHITDIGCGNGRYLGFLSKNHVKFATYTGIDSSVHLLEEAKLTYKGITQANFIVSDLMLDLEHLRGKSDIIVSFGVLHHIPGAENRLKLLRALKNNLKPNGLLILSLWQFMKDMKLATKVVEWSILPEIDPADLETNDYLLTWQRSQVPRYCHHFSDEEIESIINALNLNLVSSYQADGRDQSLNRYLILGK